MSKDTLNRKIDARGLSCPQPVIMTRNAMAAGVGVLEVWVETGTSRDNVSRMARKEGWRVEVKGIPLFGGWSNKTRRDLVGVDAPLLSIEALVAFGGLDIGHKPD